MLRIGHIARMVTDRYTSLRPTAPFETAGRAPGEKRVSRRDIEAFLSAELDTLPPLAG